MNPEEATIRAFIQESKQERCVQFLASPKNRHKFTSELCHFKWLEDRFRSRSRRLQLTPHRRLHLSCEARALAELSM